jgi:hypothetical protein
MSDDSHHDLETPPEEGGVGAVPASKRIWLGSSLVALFLLASAVRIGHLEESRIVAERQFESAIIAREYAIRDSPSVPEWRQQVAAASRRGVQQREPRITEWLVSVVYRLIDAQPLWVAGLFSSVFWLVSGWVLYRIARRVGPAESAVLSAGYFLFVPLGIVVSVSFLPDPLMIMLLLFALLAIVRHHERPSRGRLVVAASISGVAILAKPFCVFTVLAVFAALALSRKRSVRGRHGVDLLLFVLIVVALGAAYYLHGMFIADRLAVNLRAGFLPSLLLTREYWKDWLLTGSGAVGVAALILAIPGSALLRKDPGRPLLVGLAVGYVLFGIAYTVPFPKAGYYHLQLMIIVALGLGPVGALILEHLRGSTRAWWLPVLISVVLIFYFTNHGVEKRLSSANAFENPRVASEIGEIVGHSTRTLYLAPYYGRPLEYHAELTGKYWLRGRLSLDWINYGLRGAAEGKRNLMDWMLRRPGYGEVGLEERFQALEFSPDFFVITAFREFERHHSDLAEFLDGSCSLVADTTEYLLYDLTNCLGSPGGASAVTPDEPISSLLGQTSHAW